MPGPSPERPWFNDISPKFISIIQIADSGKTGTWDVRTKEGDSIGSIHWHGAWRKYAFFPDDATIYEAECLSAIVRFLNDRMSERKK